jgi:acyl carrier protein
MTVENLQEEVFKIVADQLGVPFESVKIDSNFKDDLGADSLDTVEMVMSLEDHFNIEIEDDVAETLDTPGKVIEFISKLN